MYARRHTLSPATAYIFCFTSSFLISYVLLLALNRRQIYYSVPVSCCLLAANSHSVSFSRFCCNGYLFCFLLCLVFRPTYSAVGSFIAPAGATVTHVGRSASADRRGWPALMWSILMSVIPQGLLLLYEGGHTSSLRHIVRLVLVIPTVYATTALGSDGFWSSSTVTSFSPRCLRLSDTVLVVTVHIPSASNASDRRVGAGSAEAEVSQWDSLPFWEDDWENTNSQLWIFHAPLAALMVAGRWQFFAIGPVST